MDWTIIPVFAAASLVALLTFYSGFGLGTLLMPVFALVWGDVPLAIGATAIVHLANNLLKAGLVGRHADRGVVLRFGVAAAAASFVGAWVLSRLAHVAPLHDYTWFGRVFEISPVNLVIAVLMISFALFEVVPALTRISFPPSVLPIGGLLSGFFGGLSGHQGPLRGAFLMRCGLDKAAYIGTGAACAIIVDTARLAVYGFAATSSFADQLLGGPRSGVVIAGLLGAFAGTLIGHRWLHKITMGNVRGIVTVLLFGIAIALGAGWI